VEDEIRMAELLRERAARLQLLSAVATPRLVAAQDRLLDHASTVAWAISLPGPATEREAGLQIHALLSPQNLRDYAEQHREWSLSVMRHLDQKIGPGGKWIPQGYKGAEWTPETWRAYIESVMSDWLPPDEREAAGTDPG
jgi:hypothetical protein